MRRTLDMSLENIKETNNNLGIQPIDALMVKLGLTNTDLVSASTQQLTHKMVARGRRGRRLTLNAQTKILIALKSLRPELNLTLKDVFNYH